MSAVFVRLPNNALGANITDMQTLSSTMRNSITQIESVFKTIDNQINRTTWSGPDATNTANSWNSTRAQVSRQLQTMLDCMAQAIKNQATQQENASAF